MAIQSHFIRFHKEIMLGRKDPAYSAARKKDDSMTDEIKKVFKEKGYPVIDNFIQGSFATATAIHNKTGDFDIDRALVIKAEGAPTDPVELKKVILEVLEKRGFKNAIIKKPCVTADYSSEKLHIDFPLYTEDNGDYKLAVGKRTSDDDNKEWSPSAPKALINWINDSTSYGVSASSKQQQFNRIVRYLKRWRDEKFSDTVTKKVYSIGLTVMAKRCFAPALDDDGTPNDLKALKETITNILLYGFFSNQGNSQYKVSVHLPVDPYRDIFDSSSLDTGTQLRNKLTNMEEKLQETLGKDDEVKQCKVLNKLFGEDFIIPDESESNTTKKQYSTAGAVGTSQGA